MSAVETKPTEDLSAAAKGTPTHGSLAYLYGFEPVIVFDELPDGTIEVGRFATFEYHPASDLNVGPRAALPEALLPVPPSPDDRVAALEDQVRVLTELLTQMARAQGASLEIPATPAASTSAAAAVSAAAPTATVGDPPAPPAPAEPAAPAAPAQPFGAPPAPTAPDAAGDTDETQPVPPPEGAV